MMTTQFSLADLNAFRGSQQFFKHWGIRQLVHTEGVQYLAEKANCHWLIDEIAFLLQYHLLQEHPDSFYCVEFHADNNQAVLTIGDGDGQTYVTHNIDYTDFPVQGKTIKFYVCRSCYGYTLMLTREY